VRRATLGRVLLGCRCKRRVWRLRLQSPVFEMMPCSSNPALQLPHPTHVQDVDPITGLRVLRRNGSRRFRENREQYRIELRPVRPDAGRAVAHAE